MSAEATPISPARFAAALKDLPLTTLHLKAAELRNSIAHLDYSNEQLAPFASPPADSSEPADPVCIEAIQENEQVIKRMSERIALLKTEVESRGASWLEFLGPEDVVKALAEGRGLEGANSGVDGDAAPVVNGANGVNGTHTDSSGSTATQSTATGASNPWADGTFQTGRISNGQVTMDPAPNSTTSTSTSTTANDVTAPVTRVEEEEINSLHGHVPTNSRASGTAAGSQGGRIGDEEMRRRMEERMREAMGDDDEEDGMHL